MQLLWSQNLETTEVTAQGKWVNYAKAELCSILTVLPYRKGAAYMSVGFQGPQSHEKQLQEVVWPTG